MTTKTYTFRTNQHDPAPLVMTLAEWFEHMPHPQTTNECMDQLREWMDEDHLPTRSALYNALARSPYLMAIPGPRTRFVSVE